MQDKKKELSERLLNFAADIIKLVIQLSKTAVGRRICNLTFEMSEVS